MILWDCLALQNTCAVANEICFEVVQGDNFLFIFCVRKKLLCDNKLTGTLLNHLIRFFYEFHTLITYNHGRLHIQQRNNFLTSVFVLLVEI